MTDSPDDDLPVNTDRKEGLEVHLGLGYLSDERDWFGVEVNSARVLGSVCNIHKVYFPLTAAQHAVGDR